MATNGGKKPEQTEARKEGRPLPWRALTDGQLQAARRVCRLVNWLAENSKDNADAPEGQALAYSQIEHNRRNQVILIDGGRGSGKTALLLTLLQRWKEALLGSRIAEGDGKWYEEGLLEREQRIVPLDIIDLRALQPSRSLILHMAGVLNRVVQMMEPEPEPADQRRPVPWSPYEGAQLESRKRWNEFLRAAALGWDGNLRDRQAHIDPESFVAELDMSERDRLDVIPTFRQFARALVSDYRRWHAPRARESQPGVEPLFILPVDDADMNPERVAELLQLTELLRHPRLVFLIAGESELFLATLKVHFAGAMRAPAGDVSLSMEELNQLGVWAQYGELARRLYDKVVPPHHRCVLDPILPEKREQLLLNGTADDGERQREGGEMSDVQENAADPDAVIVTLQNHFAQQPRARYALPDRVRPLLDLREWLWSHTGANHDITIAEFVVRLWGDAVMEEVYLTKDEQERMYRQVRLADAAVRRHIEGIPISIERDPSLAIGYKRWHLRAPEVEVPLPDDTYLEASFYLASFDSEPLGTFSRVRVTGSDRSETVVIPLGPRTVGTWILANHVAHQPPGDTKATGSTKGVDLAGIRLTSKEARVQVRNLNVSWPLPEWSEGDQRIEILRSRWLEALADLSPTGGGPTRTIADYGKALISILLDVIKSRGQSSRPSKDIWEGLAVELVDLARQLEPDGRDEETRNWARLRAPLLAAPESGLEATAAEGLLRALETAWGADWESVKSALLTERQNRIANALAAAQPTSKPAPTTGASSMGNTATELIKLIDKTWTSHPWFLPKQGPTPRARAVKPTKRHR